ncbi:hypothetical protein GWK08_09305 [Leptobacterium flavescens]|uniref:TraB/GumN family protein n=1 Tax=Leptobacterium flavescens TaxID=472055 RepID=A0A6P0URY6_9FLAO|nr:ChaN family lipoprotein [Leptobacterium flavescens]NER13633.1 hypothetical protein [Leptobacterium flavescens]
MKGIRIFTFLILAGFFVQSCDDHKKTELILLGTIHSPTQNFNSDTLYNILVRIKPDVILYEVDSSFFDDNFRFNRPLKSNEFLAVSGYRSNYPVEVRPYDFTGRNEYRITVGSRPTDSKALKLLDSLYRQKLLKEEHERIYSDYQKLNESLNSLVYMPVREFNTSSTDSLAALRQSFQYEQLKNIISETPEFSEAFAEKPNGELISYAEGYRLASDFWHLRNRTMASNISKMIREFKGKRLVVLNGFFHRYYLRSELSPKQETDDFIIREFYEFDGTNSEDR